MEAAPMFHEPLAGVKLTTAPALFIVPVRLAARPVRLTVPSPAVVKVPPSSTVALVVEMVPALVQLPPMAIVALVVEFTDAPAEFVNEVGAMLSVPADAWKVPMLVTFVLLMVSVRPSASALMRPRLVSVSVLELEMLRLPPAPAARRMTPVAPMNRLPFAPTAPWTLRDPAVAPSADTRSMRVYSGAKSILLALAVSSA